MFSYPSAPYSRDQVRFSLSFATEIRRGDRDSMNAQLQNHLYMTFRRNTRDFNTVARRVLRRGEGVAMTEERSS